MWRTCCGGQMKLGVASKMSEYGNKCSFKKNDQNQSKMSGNCLTSTHLAAANTLLLFVYTCMKKYKKKQANFGTIAK